MEIMAGILDASATLVPAAVPGPITWAPTEGIKSMGRLVAGIVLVIWLVAVVITFLMPGKGSRNLFRKMGFVGITFAVIAVLVMANLQVLPDIGNWAYTNILVAVWNSIPGLTKIS